ncbi:MAG: hypothetical protein KGJ07_08735 [Patescibacteria group bacterium]|nr:hypothetical protein [Patescibacteria group bacterium]
MKLLFPSLLLNCILIGIVVWGVMTGNFPHQNSVQKPVENISSPVQTVGINKTWNLLSTSSHITFLDAQKTERIISGNKRYTATKNKSFFILNILLSNTGTDTEEIAGTDLPTVHSGSTVLDPYFTLSKLTLDQGSVVNRSLVYVVDNAQKIFSVVVQPFSAPQQILTITFK